MRIPIRICEQLYDEAKRLSVLEMRSITKQIEYWAKIGKCALDNPDLSTETIKEIISKQLQENVV